MNFVSTSAAAAIAAIAAAAVAVAVAAAAAVKPSDEMLNVANVDKPRPMSVDDAVLEDITTQFNGVRRLQTSFCGE